MNEKATLKSNAVVQHIGKLRIQRFQAIRAAMPKQIRLNDPDAEPTTVSKRVRKPWEAYVWMVTGQLGKRKLARVVYPWQQRPLDPKKHPEARVKRGRLSNPTALQ